MTAHELINRMTDKMTDLQRDMTASACDDNRRFVDGVVYGIEMAKSSAWATLKASEQVGGSPCYIVCQKPGKVFRTDLAHVKQRTTKACKGYERKENETSEEAEKA